MSRNSPLNKILIKSDLVSQVNYQDLRIYITDQRFPVERKTSAHVTAKVVNEGNVWYVEVRDLLKKLQNGPVAVEGLIYFLSILNFLMIYVSGIVKMSCSDPYDPSFSLCFLRMTGDTILEATPANPLYLPLLHNGTLRLTIDHVSFASIYLIEMYVHGTPGYG
jgi:hypothetical protein